MKRSFVVLSLFACLFGGCGSAQAKCLMVMVQVHGEIVGEIHEGDVLLLDFIYSSKRIESSSAQTPQGHEFTLLGAYSTFKRRGIFHADVCGAAPHQIQLVMRDKNNVKLDVVDLTAPDEPARPLAEVSYGKKQLIVVHRPPTTQR